MDEQTLRPQICAADGNTVFMRTVFPEYQTELVKRVLSTSALSDEGVLLRLLLGVCVKPMVMDSVNHNETTV